MQITKEKPSLKKWLLLEIIVVEFSADFLSSQIQPTLAEQYEQLELENGTGTNSSSTYYEESKELYLDESEEIDLPADEVLFQEMRGKNHPFSGNANKLLGLLNAQGKT